MNVAVALCRNVKVKRFTIFLLNFSNKDPENIG